MSIEIIRDLTLEKARLGVEAETFLSSNLGRYLTERAELEVEQLKEQLVYATTEYDGQVIRNKIAIARQFGAWLNEAINEGLMAIELIRESEG